MYGELKNFMVEYEMSWAKKVVESDIIDVEAYDKWQAERKVKEQIQEKNKKATVTIKSAIEC